MKALWIWFSSLSATHNIEDSCALEKEFGLVRSRGFLTQQNPLSGWMQL